MLRISKRFSRAVIPQHMATQHNPYTKLHIMSTFEQLTIEERQELYAAWRNKYQWTSHYFGPYVEDERLHQYIELPKHGFYEYKDPVKLVHDIASVLRNKDFQIFDNGRGNNDRGTGGQFSATLRKYLTWVYHYISQHDRSCVENFKKAVYEHSDNYRKLINEINSGPEPKPGPGNGTEDKPKNSKGEVYPWNRILYGAPGTGKSHLLKLETEELPPDQIERVTFHPEYTYFDFVGSYKPIMVEKNGDEVIAYHFEAGPFAKTLKNALLHSDKYYYLIIEEINRARAAAVFGDLFQLLDRDSKGRSEYGITPSRDFAKYLTENNEDGDGVQLESDKLYLPDNFFIWATMNSADQGVFPLDTAFKRRWSFEYIPIDQNENEIKEYKFGEHWNTLRKHVNTLLQNAGINEDKQLGAFFLKEEELSDEEHYKKAIKEKVIMYLYEDAARHQRRDIFKDENARFSDICQKFDGKIESTFIGIDEQ